MNKRFIGTIAAIVSASVLCSSNAFALAVRRDKSLTKGAAARPTAQANDVFFDDFTGFDVGARPSYMFNNGIAGSVYEVRTHDVGGKLKKNCLVVDDTVDTGGPCPILNITPVKGYVKAEMRYKFIPTGETQWPCARFYFSGDSSKNGGVIAQTIFPSNTGWTVFNNGQNSSLETTALLADTWYVMTYYFDFNSKLINVSLTNEGTGKTTYVRDEGFTPGEAGESLQQLRINCLNFTGEWVFDYIRISQESKPAELPAENIKKGVTPINAVAVENHAIDGRINVKVNDKFKYLSAKPYLTEDGNVMITAKNAAAVLDMSYIRLGDVFTLKKDGTEIVLKDGQNSAQINGSAVQMPEAAKRDTTQLYVPLGFLAERLGYEYSYDTETQTAVLSNAGGEQE